MNVDEGSLATCSESQATWMDALRLIRWLFDWATFHLPLPVTKGLALFRRRDTTAIADTIATTAANAAETA